MISISIDGDHTFINGVKYFKFVNNTFYHISDSATVFSVFELVGIHT